MGLFSRSARTRFCPAQVKDSATGHIRQCQNPVSEGAKGCYLHPNGVSGYQTPAGATPIVTQSVRDVGHEAQTASTVDFEAVASSTPPRGTREYINVLEMERNDVWAERDVYGRTCAQEGCGEPVYPNQGCIYHGDYHGRTWSTQEKMEYEAILDDFQERSLAIREEIHAYDEAHPEEVAARLDRIKTMQETGAVFTDEASKATAQRLALAAAQDALRRRGIDATITSA